MGSTLPGQNVQATNEKESSYPFEEEHTKDWNILSGIFGSFPENTEIARAWARLYDRGIRVGSPLSEEYTVEKTVLKQEFLHATAEFLTKDNVNSIVVFYDARGVVGSESGM